MGTPTSSTSTTKTPKPAKPPALPLSKLSKPTGGPPLVLSTYEVFRAHPWVTQLEQTYAHDAAVAEQARLRVIHDLEEYNRAYFASKGRVAFTSVEGRTKTPESFFKKLYDKCVENGGKKGLTSAQLRTYYDDIKDLCGVRFACPYYDEIALAIAELRTTLGGLGYATDLRATHPDKNYLDSGDPVGYRSYHFFIQIPAPVDIFGNVELRLCEVQARSELQHVWAIKSHDLLYKQHSGWDFADKHVIEDMRAVSQNLRSADQFLLSIRDRAKVM